MKPPAPPDAVTRVDPALGTILYWYTRDERADDCPRCVAGGCVQRVERSDRWDGDLIIHDPEDLA